jgi:SEC-C motif
MIFSIEPGSEPEKRRLVARVAGEGGVETYDCTVDACPNPVCRCRTTNMVLRPRTPGLPERKVGLDLDTRGIDELFAKRATTEAMAYGVGLLAAMDEANFALLDSIHYTMKNRICEEAAPSEVKARFDFDEIERSSLMQAYNDILPFGDRFMVAVGGADYVLLDQYCVRPGCKCTDAYLNVFPVEDRGKLPGATGVVSVDYDAARWEPVAGEPLACDTAELRRQMESASPGLYKRLRARHKKVRAIYAHCRRRELEARHAVQDAAPVGRNDPCPCGSGKKYKKCCVGKMTRTTLLGGDRESTAAVITATKAPRIP